MELYLPRLTGLRGIAAFIVFISHAANLKFLPSSVFGHKLGQTGVMIFFILSGFLMSYLYLNKDLSPKNLVKFSLSRMGRILPLYFTIIIISPIISNYIYSDFRYNELIDKATFLKAILFIRAPQELWTIPTEVQFYFLFPVVWYLYKRYKKITYSMLVLIFMFISTFMIYFYTGKLMETPFYLLVFFLGVYTPFILTSNAIKPIKNSHTVLPLVIFLLLFLRDIGFYYYGSFQLDLLYWIIIYSLFLFVLLEFKTLNFLTWKPIIFLGEISYGFYLIHRPIMEFIHSEVDNSFLSFITVLLLTILISTISYYYFEKPLLMWIKSLPPINFKLGRVR